MNRIDRLFAILLKISDGKLFQADKLAAEFELSERTIYRDMSALIQMGIPIRSEAGVGYQLKDGYFLPPLLFEKDEAIAAGFALKFLTTYSSPHSRKSPLDALKKIESILPKTVRGEYLRELEVLDFVPMSLEIPFSNEYFRLLLTAIKNSYVVEMEYHAFKKDVSEIRQIEPMKLFFAPGLNRLYLDAYCLTRNDWRIFRLDRIVQVKTTETRFFPRIRPDYHSPSESSAVKSATLYTKPKQARWIRERQHWSFVNEKQNPDGLVEWTYEGFDWPSFIDWLCTVSDCVVSVEPSEARNQLRKKISDLQKLLT
ncbi:YafY family transcriptional regulator [Myxococcota bacterium]|nr:YafY family transcriptional regulator [Myxococcota bacterium]MBU1380581.1 YafY family transcriptional regulator [Myxococcota bacterium]MBU1497159.1 YafY family transcriptional regulator [Myxococcota bacterium]